MADSTLHGQMTSDLRTLITSGELAPGSALPSESQLGAKGYAEQDDHRARDSRNPGPAEMLRHRLR
jgi:hypothetical protein